MIDRLLGAARARAGRPGWRRAARATAPGMIEPLHPWTHADRSESADPAPAPQVAVLVYRGVTSTEVELVADALARPLRAEVALVAADPGPLPAVEPARMVMASGFDTAPAPHGLVIPGGLGWRREAGRPEVAAWLGTVVGTARGVLAVSTGSLLLASVGVLEGRDAAGHWLAGDLLTELGARPTSARVVRGRLLVTASGARSGADAAADLAREMRYAPW